MKYVCCMVLMLASSATLESAYLFKNGRFNNVKNVATLSLEEHYQKGMDALKAKDWDGACAQFRIVTVSFEGSALAKEALYYLAVSLYEKGEVDLANSEFSGYLKKNNTPAHFEDIYRYKLAIALKLASGTRCHMFGYEAFPKIASGKDLALELFDEVASALPSHELAASALLGAAELLFVRKDFDKAIDTYQTAIRRFPCSVFALEAYQGISKCYRAQVRKQPQNVDALALAEINVRQLRKEFPQAKEVAALERQLETMGELHVESLYQTGLLYERKSCKRAAVLYYHLAASKASPTSRVAEDCRKRMKDLSQYVDELHLPQSA